MAKAAKKSAQHGAEKTSKGPSLVIQLAAMLVLTAAALGAGWMSGHYLRATEQPQPAIASAAPVAGAHDKANKAAKGEEEAEDGKQRSEVTGSQRMVIPLATLTTNLAAPTDVWIRVEASIVLDQPPADLTLPDTIHQDLLGYMRTLKLHEIEGPSGFRHLRSDLDERAAVRSGGLVKQVLIRTLLFE